MVIALIKNLKFERDFKLALKLRDKEDYTSSLKVFKNLIKNEYKIFESYANLGAIYYFMEEYELALKYINLALSIKSDDMELFIIKGYVLNKLGKYEESLNYFDKVLNSDQLKEYYHSVFEFKGLSLYNLGRFDEALEAYNCSLELNPSNIEVLNNKSNTLYNLNLIDEALDSCNSALELDPGNSFILA